MAPEPNPEPAPVHILVVEDEVLIRTNLAEALREAGFSVVEAANADEAWSYLQAGVSVDLIFSDIQMPGTMNGIELSQRVKQQRNDITVILTSGDDGSLLSHPQEIFIKKPYRFAKIVAFIRSYLEKN